MKKKKKEKEKSKYADMPQGLGMALSKDTNAMEAFSDMPETMKKELINKARNVASKQEMEDLVSNIYTNFR